ncbi:MAG: hypothetical protein MJ213_03805 [Bacilli bacterium]|nr:hypothetical protein [Bacilli bacterium]
MKNAKTGLRLLSFSIFVTIAWSFAAFIIGIIQGLPDSKVTIDVTLIASCISVGCYLIELIGLHVAGKDNTHFHRASFLKIGSLLLAVVCIVLAAVSQNMNNDAKQTIGIVTNVINIVISVADVIALISIVKGCKEIAPRVKGQANLILACFIIMAVATIVISFMSVANVKDNIGLTILALLLSIAAVVAAVIYAINYIILIFRTTKNIGKSR